MVTVFFMVSSYRIGVGGQFPIDARRAAARRDESLDHPVGGVSFARTTAVIEIEADNAQRFGHGPRYGGGQIVRPALDSYRLLQCPRHTALRSSS